MQKKMRRKKFVLITPFWLFGVRVCVNNAFHHNSEYKHKQKKKKIARASINIHCVVLTVYETWQDLASYEQKKIKITLKQKNIKSSTSKKNHGAINGC